MEKIKEILENNSWSKITVKVEDHGNVILDNFTQEQTFTNYLKNKLFEFDIIYLGHELQTDEENNLTVVFNFSYGDAPKILSDEYIKELAEDIMLDLTTEEILDIKQTESLIRQKFLKVLTIETDKVEPMFYPTNEIHTYLREDNEFYVADQKEVLKNAASIDGDYITIVKVVQ